LCEQRTFTPSLPLAETELALLLALVNDGHLVLHKPRRR